MITYTFLQQYWWVLVTLLVGCSKSMIFFCMVFDLDKEAFY